MNELVFLDTETTGRGLEDRLVQLCMKLPGFVEKIYNKLFKPPIPITFEAMAVHHITREDVADKKPFDTQEQFYVTDVLAGKIVVAHNAEFDIEIMKREGVVIERFIDTLKVAQNLFDEPSYKLQYLRYRFGLRVDARAHDAEGDVAVLEEFFNFLCLTYQGLHRDEQDDSAVKCLAWMERISREPVMMRRIPFGKHKGKEFAEIAKADMKYLEWLSGQKDINIDLRTTLDHWLGKKTINSPSALF